MMTAFVLQIGAKTATVAGDSLAYLVDRRPIGTMSKILPLPQARTALIFRGQYSCIVAGWSALMEMLDLDSVEKVCDRLPAVLRDVAEQYCRSHGIGDYRSILFLEVAAIGFSAKTKGIKLAQFLNLDGFNAEWLPDGWQGTKYFPYVPEYAPKAGSGSPDAQLVEGVIGLGRYLAQHDRIKVGGEVIACEISAKGLESRILHRFSDYQSDRTAGAAIEARIMRGDYDADMLRKELVGGEEIRRLDKAG